MIGKNITWRHRVVAGIVVRSFLLFLLLVSAALVGMLRLLQWVSAKHVSD